MGNARIWSISRVAHHVGWWVFVVATLFAGGVTWLGGRRHYDSIAPGRGSITYHGSYEPLNGVDMSKAYSTSLDITAAVEFRITDAPAVMSLIAVIVVVITAVIEAIAFRQIVIGVATVVIPLVAVGVIAFAVPSGTRGFDLDNTATMVLVLIGIAIHQSWMFYTGRHPAVHERPQ